MVLLSMTLWQKDLFIKMGNNTAQKEIADENIPKPSATVETASPYNSGGGGCTNPEISDDHSRPDTCPGCPHSIHFLYHL